MHVAVISDPHGNLLALDAVLADLDATGPYDEIVMAGDFAFGGPFPAECVERIRERRYRAVRGNTDEKLVALARNPAAPPEAPMLAAVGRWCAERLSRDQIDYLASLPLQVTVPDQRSESMAVVHATPWNAEDVIPPDVEEDLVQRALEAAGSPVLAYGHIHLQYERRLPGGLVACVGSVGMPFNGDQRAQYAVFSSASDGWSVGFRRVPYDVDAAIEQVLRSGVPYAEVFAGRLRTATAAGG